MITECNLCGGKVEYVNHQEVYGREYSDWPYIYLCENCGAYVGVHEGTDDPLGTLADKRTRDARKAAHAAFDLLWKGGEMTRDGAYEWLSQQLEIPQEECHIGMFEIAQCEKVITIMMKKRSQWREW